LTVRRRRFAVALLTLLAPVLAALTLAQAESESFHRVGEGVAIGAQPTVEQIALLSREGFRTVINLREPSEHDAAAEEAAVRDLAMDYVNIPVRTSDPKDGQAEEFLKVLANGRIYPVLVHCGTANRAAAFWMIRRIVVDRWSPEAAEKEAREIGLKSPNLRDFALDYARRRASRES
jgi:uncharacterized protein (TIGR01244 family)